LSPSERIDVIPEDDFAYPKRPDPKMELEGVAAGVDDDELPGTLTSGYSKSGGLGETL
jgi:hypothetical protein